MSDKKLPKHKRLYKDSPKLERGDDGNMQAKKPSESQKEADKVQGGVEQAPDIDPSGEARIQEIKDMHKRHQTEMEAIHKRHQKEDVKKSSKDETEKEGAGKKEVEEVDKSKEITE